jgi:Cupin domain
MAFWTCRETARSAPHVHDFDEYMIVVQGCYTLIVDDKRIPVRAGEEYFIPKLLRHGGEPMAGTRTIHAFGGHRAERSSAMGSDLPSNSEGLTETAVDLTTPREKCGPIRRTFFGI